MSKTKTRNRRVVVVLLVVVLGMFGFGFVLIPIYRMMANIYGFGGEMHADESSRAKTQDQFEKVLKNLLPEDYVTFRIEERRGQNAHGDPAIYGDRQ